MTFRLVICFMLLVFARPQEWLFPWLYGIPLLDVVFALSVFFLLVEKNEGKLKFPPKSPQTWLMLGVVLASMMSHIAHTYLAALIATTPLILKTVLFSILVVTVMDRVEKVRTMGRLIVATTCLMAVHAILQETRGVGLGGDGPEWMYSPAKGWYSRSMFYGIFADPNDMAQMFVVALPFTFGLTRKPSFWGWLLGVGLSWLMIRGLMTTHSRGGMVGLAVTLSVMLIMKLPVRWMPTLLAIMTLGVLIGSPAMASGRMDESAHERLIYWGQANYAFKRNLLFGVGTNMIADYIEKGRAVHNAYVLCYTETGIFGYWFWYGLIHLGITGAWRVRKAIVRPKTVDEAWMRKFSGQAIAGMAGYCAAGYFLGRAFIYPTFLMFGLLAAIPMVARPFLPDNAPPLINVRKDLFVTSSIGAAASILYIYVSIVALNHLAYEP